jgi:hypothetical protein
MLTVKMVFVGQHISNKASNFFFNRRVEVPHKSPNIESTDLRMGMDSSQTHIEIIRETKSEVPMKRRKEIRGV